MRIRKTKKQKYLDGLVGGNIRYIRDDIRKIKQDDLARNTNLEVSTLSLIERGKTSTTLYNIAVIAKVLCVDLHDLIDYDIGVKYRKNGTNR